MIIRCYFLFFLAWVLTHDSSQKQNVAFKKSLFTKGQCFRRLIPIGSISHLLYAPLKKNKIHNIAENSNEIKKI